MRHTCARSDLQSLRMPDSRPRRGKRAWGHLLLRELRKTVRGPKHSRPGFVMKRIGKCAHPACHCPASDADEYCSAYCREAGKLTEVVCKCGHADKRICR